MASIATRTGDDGSTSLLYGQRVLKHHPQIEAVGAFDELNVAIGVVKPLMTDPPTLEHLRLLQQNLVSLMGELACAEEDAARYAASAFAKVTRADVQRVSDAVTELEARGLKFEGWATPGANALAAAIEQARVVARRAERRLVVLPSHGRNVRPELLQFINRLSDLLWLMARAAEK
jgi:cob(I)alamin adenosyltransferase